MKHDKFHPLTTGILPPQRFTFPFCYEPHPLCRLAAGELQRYLAGEMQADMKPGKMFGVLVVERDGRMGYLAAYSGLLNDSNNLPYFVPAVYDMLQPDGYFKANEQKISDINKEVETIENSSEYRELTRQLSIIDNKAEEEIGQHREKMREAKERRERIRSAGCNEGGEESLIRESQFMKAELNRIKKRYKTEREYVTTLITDVEDKMEQLKRERKRRSDELQLWLFRQFRMLNARGEERDLVDIFAETAAKVPPSGAGECCAPKLLQYAFAHGMRPLCMAEFWWGESPKTEIRHHLQYYPACNGKCKPILAHMLKGLDVDPDPLAKTNHEALDIIYEDESIAVVCKPPGMLSVPGKSQRPSVLSIMREHTGAAEDIPMIVHRLDMDTSGLMVIAKTAEAYHSLQRQFLERIVRKRYIAVLDCSSAALKAGDKGTIDLAMRADHLDRPRQTIDHTNGKRAITEYRILGVKGDRAVAMLSPHTGRTHQLRVHCASSQGLNAPIVGDPLYGKGGGRLCLHAEYLEITHPQTGRRIHFDAPHPFGAVEDFSTC